MTIFDLDPASLGDLSADEGIALLAQLLRCEAARLGIPLHKVVISTRTLSKDGGIDAKVIGSKPSGSLLAKGSIYFQVKTGFTFKPWQKAQLVKELFGKAGVAPSRAKLGSEVKACLNARHRYVLVTFGHDLLPKEHAAATGLLKDLLTACNYADVDVEVIGQGQLVGYLARYPSICLDLKGSGNTPFLSYKAWSERSDMAPQLHVGSSQQQFVDQIRSAWRSTEFQHIRIIGEPGIGKTRLVLNAASEPDLSAVTIYVPHAEDFQASPLFNEILKPDRDYTAALIIDECEEQERASIWLALKGKPRLKLITLDHGPERSSDSSMLVLQCPVLEDAEIAAILKDYIGQSIHISNWVNWCEGSPRVAHAVGDNLKRNPDDILKEPATVPIWERFVVGGDKTDSQNAQENLLVFRHLALFQRFGFTQPVSAEGRFISELVRQANPNITWARFQSIIKRQRDRRILQGRHTLFIVPKALHVHYWVSYWNEHGVGFDFASFYEQMPVGLRHWFMRPFIYAHASPNAKSLVRSLLHASSGPFSKEEFLLSKFGTSFISHLAEADPHATMALIERTFGSWPHQKLLAWTEERQTIVLALEKIAVWSDLFLRAASALSRMAQAESSNYGNNSKGTLKGLFIIGEGWAPTCAPPSARFPLVAALLEEVSQSAFELGLELATEWLQTYGGGRSIGPEYQGLRPTIQFWRPSRWGEIFSAWLNMWEFLTGLIGRASGSRKAAIGRVMVARGLDLVKYRFVAKKILSTLRDLSQLDGIDRMHFISSVATTFRRPESSYSPATWTSIKALDRALTGSTFWNRVTRYVLAPEWFDYRPDATNDTSNEKRAKRKFRLLVNEAVKSDELLRRHLAALIIAEGRLLSQFAFEIAKGLKNARFDAQVVEALAATKDVGNSNFGCGYFVGIRLLDLPRWEALVLKLLENASLQITTINIIRQSGFSEAVVKKLLAMLRENVIYPQVFDFLGHRAHEGQISEGLCNQVVDALTARQDEKSLDIAIETLDGLYAHFPNDRRLPKASTFDLLAALAGKRSGRTTMRDFYVHRVLVRYRSQYPEEDLCVLKMLLRNFSSLTRVRSPHDIGQIADDIVRKYPLEAWPIIAGEIEANKERARDIVGWLGDSKQIAKSVAGPMRSLDAMQVIEWIQQDPDKRIPLMSRSLPKTVDLDDGGLVTRAYIERFATRAAIAGDLIVHFIYGESWSGPRSAHLRSKRDEARRWIGVTAPPAVLKWVERYIEYLNAELEVSEINEERELF